MSLLWVYSKFFRRFIKWKATKKDKIILSVHEEKTLSHRFLQRALCLFSHVLPRHLTIAASVFMPWEMSCLAHSTAQKVFADCCYSWEYYINHCHCLDWGWYTFPIKVQVVNTFVFVGCTVSVSTPHLCSCTQTQP